MTPDEYHRFNNKASAEANGVAFANAFDAPHLADLRKLSIADLQAQPWLLRTYFDGYLINSDLTMIYRTHRQNDVPLLVGRTAEEGKYLAPQKE